MSDFAGMEDLLKDFLQESYDLLSDVDNKLVELEKNPKDRHLLNDIFRGFHTIKGGAGFLNASELVILCHLTENLFDKLRNGELNITAGLMDVIMAATQGVHYMFGELDSLHQPKPASPDLIKKLNGILNENCIHDAQELVNETITEQRVINNSELNWQDLHDAVRGAKKVDIVISDKKQTTLENFLEDKNIPFMQNNSRKKDDKSKDTTIRVDTERLDQVLNLSGEIGLTKNRLTSLRSEILTGKVDNETLQALDEAVSQLDLLVSDLQNSVMKTRMQPIGRLFQRYPRIARDLARQLGKEVELILIGEETEIDKTMIEDLSDPLIHLIRNAVDHGVEMPQERISAGKPEKSIVTLEAKQEGDHIVITISDDGKGMSPVYIRNKAVEKGLITADEANTLDDNQSLNLVFLPGFSTKTEISDVSGRGVGMDVVKTNIQKLNGNILINSEEGKGTTFIISLPLTLAILPVLLVVLDNKPFALPLTLVREILPLPQSQIKEVAGKDTLVIRGEVLPITPLSKLLGWDIEKEPEYGVFMQVGERRFILGVDSFAGRDDAVIKSLDDFRPKGISGVTTLSNGQIVLILDMNELLADFIKEIEKN